MLDFCATPCGANTTSTTRCEPPNHLLACLDAQDSTAISNGRAAQPTTQSAMVNAKPAVMPRSKSQDLRHTIETVRSNHTRDNSTSLPIPNHPIPVRCRVCKLMLGSNTQLFQHLAEMHPGLTTSKFTHTTGKGARKSRSTKRAQMREQGTLIRKPIRTGLHNTQGWSVYYV